MSDFLDRNAARCYQQYNPFFERVALLFPTELAAARWTLSFQQFCKKPVWGAVTYTFPRLSYRLLPLQKASSLKRNYLLYQAARAVGWIDQSITFPYFVQQEEELLPLIESLSLYAPSDWPSLMASASHSKKEKEAPALKRLHAYWEALPLLQQKYHELLTLHQVSYPARSYQLLEELLSTQQPNRLPFDLLWVVGFTYLPSQQKKLLDRLSKQVAISYHTDSLTPWLTVPAVSSSFHPLPELKTLNQLPTQWQEREVLVSSFTNPLTSIQAVVAELVSEQTKGRYPLTAIVLPDRMMADCCSNLLLQEGLSFYNAFLPCLADRLSFTYYLALLTLWQATQAVTPLAEKGRLDALEQLLLHPFSAYLATDLVKLQKALDQGASWSLLAERYQTTLSALFYEPSQLSLFPSYGLVLTEKLKRSLPSFPLKWRQQKRIELSWLERFLQEFQQAAVQIDLSRPAGLWLLEREAKTYQLPLQQKGVKEAIYLLPLKELEAIAVDRVYMLGLEEGRIPSLLPKVTASALPLPYAEKLGYPSLSDSLGRAHYLFYKTICQAERSTLTYLEQDKAGVPLPKSRFLAQLSLSNRLVRQSPLFFPTPSSTPTPPKTIPKRAVLFKQLETFVFTPSAINRYLQCPMLFYWYDLLGYKEAYPTPPPSLLPKAALGTLLHNLLEELYSPYLGKTLTHKQLKEIKMSAKRLLPVHYHKLMNCLPEGKHPGLYKLGQEVVKGLLPLLLSMDCDYLPFQLLGLEVGRKEWLQTKITLASGQQVQLRGIIDRVDKKGEMIRIVDYKTGLWRPYVPSIPSLFDPTTTNPIALQTFFYSWLYQQTLGEAKAQLAPTILSPRKQQPPFHPHFLLKSEKGRYEPVLDFTPLSHDFLAGLRQLLETIYDPKNPFKHPAHLPPTNCTPFCC